MLVNVKCRRCGNEGKFDIGDMTKEEAEAKLRLMKTFHCSFGNHVELMPPTDFMDIDWDNGIEGQAPSEKDFLDYLESNYTEVLTLEELKEKYYVDSFAFGKCLVHSKKDEDNIKLFDFVHSPGEKRYYIWNEPNYEGEKNYVK